MQMGSEQRPRATNEPAMAMGLEGVVVAESKLSHVDGEQGRLIIAGRDVESLALELSIEQMGALLWQQAAVSETLDAASLGSARGRAFAVLPSLGAALGHDHVMDSLRTGLSHLPETASALDIVAASSVFTAAWARTRARRAPIAPNPEHGHARDFLAMLGATTSCAHVRALDAYLVTVSDHGLNASTFAARVVASTGSDRVSAVVAAVGALKGPLHGGAPGPVLDMLDAIEANADPTAWIEAELRAGRRIMGMGHRIYRVRDPRAAVLERAVEALEAALVASSASDVLSDPPVLSTVSERRDGATPTTDRLRHARRVERAAEQVLALRQPRRALRCNVEFYTAVLLEAIGIPRALFSGVFAVGRALGWTAHISEQQKTGRLVRPASRYVGAWPGSA